MILTKKWPEREKATAEREKAIEARHRIVQLERDLEREQFGYTRMHDKNKENEKKLALQIDVCQVLTEKNTRLEEQLKAANETIDDLRTNLTTTRNALGQERQTVREQNDTITKLKREKDKLEAENKRNENTIVRQNAELTFRQERIEEHEKTISTQRREIEVKDKHLAELIERERCNAEEKEALRSHYEKASLRQDESFKASQRSTDLAITQNTKMAELMSRQNEQSMALMSNAFHALFDLRRSEERPAPVTDKPAQGNIGAGADHRRGADN
jgi:hypothetical protein